MSAPCNIVLQLVADEFQVPVDEFLRPGRHEPLATARSVAMSLCCDHWRLPEEAVGRLFGRSRGAVAKAKRRVRALLETDRTLRAVWDRLEEGVARALGRPSRHCVSVMVANLSSEEAALLRALVSMFTDERAHVALQGVRLGASALRWDGRTLHLQPIQP